MSDSTSPSQAGDNAMKPTLIPGLSRPGERETMNSRYRGWFLALAFLLLAALIVVTCNVWLTSRLVRQQREHSKEHAFWTLCQPGYSAEVRKNAFLLLAAEGNKEWRSASLADLDLEKVSLVDAQLETAAFRRARLAGANFSAARLIKSSFEMADLSGADLSRADLSEAQLYRTILKAAKLNRTILRGANLQEIKAEGSQFLAADLGDSDCLMADFTGASLAGANLTGARLEAAKFSGANVSLARLQETNIRDADFANCNWWRARGWNAARLDFLKKKFSPDTNAPAGLRVDFEKWVKEQK